MSAVSDLDTARLQKAAATRERELSELREDFGDYENWPNIVLHYFLDELAEGCWEDDDVTVLLGAGASIAKADLDRDPKRALNAMWMASDVLLNLYGEDLDDEARKAAEAVWDATCRLARPECGYHRSDPFTGEVFKLHPQG